MFGLSGLKLSLGLGIVLAIVVLGATVAILWSRLEAKAAEIASLGQQLELAAADAGRWQQAADQRQGVIGRQAATLRRLESDGEAARAIAEANGTKSRQRVATLEAQIAQLKEAADARPDDVRLLGPVVRNALPSLLH